VRHFFALQTVNSRNGCNYDRDNHGRHAERVWSFPQVRIPVQFNRDDALKYWSWSPLSSLIVTAASQLYQSLPESVFLRASDCLHLVTALHQGFEEICTFDRRQQQAVQVLGLTIATI
jgi:hypothetical protein